MSLQRRYCASALLQSNLPIIAATRQKGEANTAKLVKLRYTTKLAGSVGEQPVVIVTPAQTQSIVGFRF